jgi:hypothetical protein
MPRLGPRGQSGRVVIELDPLLKERLYRAVTKEGRSLKDWFVGNAESYLSEAEQMTLPYAGPEAPVRRPRRR